MHAPENAVVDLASAIRIHVVGIGGTGMSAIATVLVGMGHTVTGSDVAGSAVIDRLEGLGVSVRIGHDASAVRDVDLVTASSAVPADNIELAAATRLGIPVLSRAGILAGICALRRTLAVGGTHGKTTTASMLFSILREAGWRPSCVIGGDVHGLVGGALWDRTGQWLVVEADESDGTFIELPVEGVVVTNVESDHLEFYGGLAALRAAFTRFLLGAQGPRVASADDTGAVSVANGLGGVTTFGVSTRASVVMSEVSLDRAGAGFEVTVDGRRQGRVQLAVPGLHNARNAAGALALALRAGVAWGVGARALGEFREVARRFEPRGEADGVAFIDDYGHLPSEVKAVLATARAGGWKRVVAVFQPHRYSRTQSLHAEFADAFVDADILVLTGIYPAGERPRPGVTGKLILDAVRGAHPDADVRYVESRSDLAGELSGLLRPGDLCLTLGAGNLNTLPLELGAGPADGIDTMGIDTTGGERR